MTTRTAVYTRRAVPAQYNAGFLTAEFQNIQRAIAPSSIRRVTRAATQLPTDAYLLADTAAGTVTITLLAPSAWPVFPLTIKKADGSGNTVALVGTVDGAANPSTVTAWAAWTIISDGNALYFTSSYP